MLKRKAFGLSAALLFAFQSAALAQSSSQNNALLGVAKWAVVSFGPSVASSLGNWLKQNRSQSQAVPSSKTAQWSISWQAATGSYPGVIQMNGARGYANIRTPDGREVIQTLDALYVPRDSAIDLIGSSPRYSNGALVSNYLPDNFRILFSPAGMNMTGTCDAQGCAPIAVYDFRQ